MTLSSHDFSSVPEITPNQFILDESREQLTYPRFILFYAPWCPACHARFPQIQRIHTYLSFIEPKYRPFTIVRCNIDQYPELGKQYSIQRFPTFGWMNRSGMVQLFPSSIHITQFIEDELDKMNQSLGTLYKMTLSLDTV